MRIFGAISFIKLQNDTQTTIKRLKTMKNEMLLQRMLPCDWPINERFHVIGHFTERFLLIGHFAELFHVIGHFAELFHVIGHFTKRFLLGVVISANSLL